MHHAFIANDIGIDHRGVLDLKEFAAADWDRRPLQRRPLALAHQLGMLMCSGPASKKLRLPKERGC